MAEDEIDRILDRLVEERFRIFREEVRHVLSQHKTEIDAHAKHLMDLEHRQRKDEQEREIAIQTLHEVQDLKRMLQVWSRDRGGVTDG